MVNHCGPYYKVLSHVSVVPLLLDVKKFLSYEMRTETFVVVLLFFPVSQRFSMKRTKLET